MASIANVSSQSELVTLRRLINRGRRMKDISLLKANEWKGVLGLQF